MKILHQLYKKAGFIKATGILLAALIAVFFLALYLAGALSFDYGKDAFKRIFRKKKSVEKRLVHA